MSRCKPGDMAVVIEAANKANIGRIVKVLGLPNGRGPLPVVKPCPGWMVKAPTLKTWNTVHQCNHITVPRPSHQMHLSARNPNQCNGILRSSRRDRRCDGHALSDRVLRGVVV